jgi:hypothetical protein
LSNNALSTIADANIGLSFFSKQIFVRKNCPFARSAATFAVARKRNSLPSGLTPGVHATPVSPDSIPRLAFVRQFHSEPAGLAFKLRDELHLRDRPLLLTGLL